MATPRRTPARSASNLTLAGIAARFREPSSWAAIAAAMAALGVTVPVEIWQPVVHTGSGLAALAGVLLKERSK